MTELQMIIATAGLLLASITVYGLIEISGRRIERESKQADKLVADIENEMNQEIDDMNSFLATLSNR